MNVEMAGKKVKLRILLSTQTIIWGAIALAIASCSRQPIDVYNRVTVSENQRGNTQTSPLIIKLIIQAQFEQADRFISKPASW
jgi:hypothetical protein